ncbi:glycosyltransferase [Solemya elarraichensis gill symbiont]|uniref:Glycosyl transferase family 1 domain-containing protein n=1 Tax=Solemya elarraichensis gill symbiont TaxID=1918949 RepID=A0A1T2L4U1_9GAMM|nr:glycosyltransferase [Solemya elarraichensis gill symbiont]OOZ40113.1 hypothetical protein BOW52_06330 [Solemya elarraichensis gill symbiont]
MNTSTDNTTSARKPRILWANYYCLLDSSSGASMAVREMLIQLAKRGYEIAILGATIFDADKGKTKLSKSGIFSKENLGKFATIADGDMHHTLLVTRSIVRSQIGTDEIFKWVSRYTATLHEFKPDLVYFYGGLISDWNIADEARARGIPVAFYLANGNYHGARWSRDIDLILTDSRATADMYHERSGIPVTPIGAFIDPEPVIATQQERKHVLFINPSWAKGVSIVIMLALLLEKSRPDIIFEIVESRGNWQLTFDAVLKELGQDRKGLDNIVVTFHTTDMRPVYGRARLLLAPSLWWESSGRILAEAMLNGIPTLITDRGGMPEMIDDAGYQLHLHDLMHEKPYTRLPKKEKINEAADWITSMYDNDQLYQEEVNKAYAVGKRLHSLEASTARFEAALQPLLEQKAGDSDLAEKLKSTHRHGLADAPKPLPQTPDPA